MERKEAIEVIKKNWPDSSFTMLREALETVIPELKEGEDERIRKEIIKYFEKYQALSLGDYNVQDILAWLEKQGEQPKKHDVCDNCDQQGSCVSPCPMKLVEKQGEQKPVNRLKITAGNWYVCEMEVMNENMVTAFHRDEIYYCPKDGYLDVRGALFEVGCLDVFRLATEKEIPQTKQEWSEEEIENCAREAEDNSCIILAKHIRQLKSLSPHNTWKPSELQIEALAIAIRCGIKLGTWEEEALKDLIEQLKKLMEE